MKFFFPFTEVLCNLAGICPHDLIIDGWCWNNAFYRTIGADDFLMPGLQFKSLESRVTEHSIYTFHCSFSFHGLAIQNTQILF